MNGQDSEVGSEEMEQLGEVKLVCRTSRKTLLFGLLFVSLPCILGIAILFFALGRFLEDWSKDFFGTIILLAICGFLFWCGRTLWKKTIRKTRVQVAVHDGGLSYCDGSNWLTCRWDQVANVTWRVANQYDEVHLAVGGIIPIPGTSIQMLSHTGYQITVWRIDGVKLSFSEELQNIAELLQAIQREFSSQ